MSNKNEDFSLIKECIDGNKKAEKIFFERFYSKMLGVCLRYSKNREDAKDLLQEGFVKVFANMKKYKEEGNLDAWVKRIFTNNAIDKYRRKIKLPKQQDIEYIEIKNDKNESVFAKFDREHIISKIQELAEGYRLVFNLFAIEGYSHKEIANMLKISENTSKSQFAKAKKILQKKCKSQ